MKSRLIMVGFTLLLAGCSHENAPASNEHAAVSTASASPGALVVNGDFEQVGSTNAFPGWQFLQHAGAKSYDASIQTQHAFAGHGSFHITRTLPQVYGSLVQDIALTGLVGKTIELSAMLKSSDVGEGGWKLFVNGYLPNTIKYSPGLTGTKDWQRDTVQLKITPIMHRLTIGVTLLDSGTAWVDNVAVRVVD